MDIQFYGANCIVISTKQVRLVFDDNLASLGAKTISREGDVSLFTMPHPDSVKATKMTIDIPGEYEVRGVNIRGIQARAHMDTEHEHSATMYKVTAGDIKILVMGHIYPKLSEYFKGVLFDHRTTFDRHSESRRQKDQSGNSPRLLHPPPTAST